jgi:hypothetical protein
MGRVSSVRTKGAIWWLAMAIAGSCVPAGDEPGSAGNGGGAAGVTAAAGTAGGQAGTNATGVAGTGAAGACANGPGIKVGWTLGRDATGMGLTCAQAGVVRIDVFVDSTRHEFQCGASPAVVSPLAPGPYTVRVLVIGAQDAVIAPSAMGSVMLAGCGIFDLGTVKFTVSPSTNGGAGTGGGAGSSGAGGSGGKGGAGSSGAAGTPPPCDAKAIFAQHSCTVDSACHDAKGSAAAFDMVTAGWEKAMIGRLPKAGGASGLGSACIGSGMPYLVAGSNPARGLFLTKLGAGGTITCGARMPLVPSYLTQTELDCVQKWANGVVAAGK